MFVLWLNKKFSKCDKQAAVCFGRSIIFYSVWILCQFTNCTNWLCFSFTSLPGICEYVSVISNNTQPPQLTEHHWSLCLKWWCFWFVFGSHPVWIMDKTLTILPEGSYSFSLVLSCQHRNSTLQQATTTSFHILSNLSFTNHTTNKCHTTYTPGKLSLNKPIIIHCVKQIIVTAYILFCTDVKCLY